MKTVRAASTLTLALGLVLAVGACSPSDAESDPTSSADGSATTTPADDATTDPEASDAEDGDFADSTSTNIAASCEEFNSLMTDLRAIDSSDTEAYEDMYDLAQDARDTAPIETYDLFTAVSLLALDSSLGEESQETADMLRDAVFASAGPCTAEGVTLTV